MKECINMTYYRLRNIIKYYKYYKKQWNSGKIYVYRISCTARSIADNAAVCIHSTKYACSILPQPR